MAGASLDPYVQQLLDALAPAIAPWLERCVVHTALARTGQAGPELRDEAAGMAAREAPLVLAAVEALVATDVDAQATNPLSILRDAIAAPTKILADHGVPATRRDPFVERAFPGDVYALSPATWTDVDESLHEPGLIWGAWKAKTVLARRRAEGLIPPSAPTN